MDTDDLSERIVSSTLGLMDILTISLGNQLGLYRVLHEHGPVDVDTLASHAGIATRYAREWLEQQAVAGLIAHDDGRFALPPEHVPVLIDADSLAYLAPMADLMAAAGGQIAALAEAYRTGGGVSWAQFGPVMRAAQAAGNRPWYIGPLVQDWLPSIDGLTDRLDAGGRVLEIGSGEGWASISVAERWPHAHVDAVDVDVPSIDAARLHATEHGVHDRVTFHTDPATLPAEQSYDLVMALECLHDMPDPVSVLAAMRGRVAADGTVFVMDERAAHTFTGEGDDIERLLYGWSTLICLPDSMAHPGSVATGTVMRPETLRRYATAAGFSEVEILPLENALWRFYRLRIG